MFYDIFNLKADFIGGDLMPISKNPRSIEARVDVNGVAFSVNIDDNFYAVGEECAVLPHTHLHYELLMLDAGALDLVIDDEKHRISSGDAILLCPGEYHYKPKDAISEQTGQYTLRFDMMGNDFEVKRFEISLKRLRGTFKVGEEIKNHFGRIRSELFEERLGYKNAIRARFVIIMTELVRIFMNEQEREPFYQATTKIDKRVRLERFFSIHHTVKTTLGDLAGYLGLSDRQAARIVKSEFGKTFVEMLTEARIIHAKHELKNSEATIAEIADRCGFSSYEYFNHCFKRKTGSSPTEYRKSNKT